MTPAASYDYTLQTENRQHMNKASIQALNTRDSSLVGLMLTKQLLSFIIRLLLLFTIRYCTDRYGQEDSLESMINIESRHWLRKGEGILCTNSNMIAYKVDYQCTLL